MVRIITDSAADFEPWELEQLNISCIPLTVIFGDREYQENVNLSKEEFYSLLEEQPENPKTAQASPQILLELFRQAQAAGEEAVYITIASAISGTYQTACVTREQAGAGCYVLDSQNATGGQRILVEQAARLRDEGKTAAQIVAAIEALRPRIVLYACIDTLEYLYRGGRINQTVYKLGTIAKVKPIIRVAEDGHIEVPAKAMGMRKGMDFLCRRLELQKPSGDYPLYVMFSSIRSNGEVLARRLRDLGYEIPDSRIINVGAAIGSHIGPGGCGVVYVE